MDYPYYGYLDYPDYGYYWDYPRYGDSGYGFEPPPLLVTPASPAPDPVSPPPPPPNPVLHEYSWPEAAGDSRTAFAIVSKNGTVQRAIAVWVQEDRLCFITTEGVREDLLLSDIDRQTTAQLNSELKLKLALPIQASQQGPSGVDN